MVSRGLILVLVGGLLFFTGSLLGLFIYPPEDPDLSSEVYYVTTYGGYEIWRDPAREGVGEWIIYTPLGQEPMISRIKYTKEACFRAIDRKLEAYVEEPPEPTPSPALEPTPEPTASPEPYPEGAEDTVEEQLIETDAFDEVREEKQRWLVRGLGVGTMSVGLYLWLRERSEPS